MKIAHNYTMCKSNGYQLMLQLPTTAKGRQLAKKVVPNLTVGRRVRKTLKRDENKGPLSRAIERERPTVKALSYQQYQQKLEIGQKKAQAVQPANQDASLQIVPKKPSDVLVIIPKNGNNKKKIKIRKMQTLRLIASPGEATPKASAETKEQMIVRAAKAISGQLGATGKLSETLEHLADNVYWDLQLLRDILVLTKDEGSDLDIGMPKTLAESAIKIMTGNISMASVQDVGCEILSKLAKLSIDNQKIIGQQLKGIEALIQCMEEHKGNAVLQTKATMVLRQIIFSPRDCSSTVLKLTDAQAKRLLHVAHSTMIDHKDDQVIQVNTCWLLVAGEKVHRETFDNLMANKGGLEHTADTMRSYECNIVLQLVVAYVGMKFWSGANGNVGEITKRQSAQSIASILSSVFEQGSLPTHRYVARYVLLNWFINNCNERVHGVLEENKDGTAAFFDTCMDAGTWKANRTLRLHKSLSNFIQTVVCVCKPESTKKHHKALTDYLVDGMNQFAGDHELELRSCFALQAMAHASPEAKHYILYGDGNNEVDGKYGEADDALFALIQRDVESLHELFHVAGSLMFKLRDSSI